MISDQLDHRIRIVDKHREIGSSIQENSGCVHLGTTFHSRLEVVAVEKFTAPYQTLKPDWWMFRAVCADSQKLLPS